MKTRRRQDFSYIRVPHFQSLSTSFQRHIVLLEIVALANSKKERNIKANDVNLMSMARSTNFCFKTTYVGMFLCFRSIIRCFQCFVHGLSPLGKQFPMNPPYPSEITAFEAPLPVGISNDLLWGWYGYFLEPHNSYPYSKADLSSSRTLLEGGGGGWSTVLTLVFSNSHQQLQNRIFFNWIVVHSLIFVKQVVQVISIFVMCIQLFQLLSHYCCCN